MNATTVSAITTAPVTAADIRLSIRALVNSSLPSQTTAIERPICGM